MKEKFAWIYDVLLVAVLVVAAFLRISGADWGELQHQHPDELFLTSVVSNLRMQVCEEFITSIDACPPEKQRWMGIGDYFDTAASSLNPHNRGFGFFVYGTLPLFIVRATAEIVGQTDYGALKLLGRQFSALADLGTILLLYFIVAPVQSPYGLAGSGLFKLGCYADPAIPFLYNRFVCEPIFLSGFVFCCANPLVGTHQQEKRSACTPGGRSWFAEFSFTNFGNLFPLHPRSFILA